MQRWAGPAWWVGLTDRVHRTWTAIVRRPVLATCVVAAVLVAGCWALLGSGALDVRRVDVVGASSLSLRDVRTATRGAIGQPMLTVDVGRVRSSVAAVSSVATVSVTRQWPGTLKVTVHERQAVLAVHRPTGWLLLDRAGVPFMTAPQRPAGVLPLTVAAPSRDDAATQAAVAVVDALPRTVRARVAAVSAPTPAGVQLRLSGGVTVVWGGADGSARKATALAALLHRKIKDASVYDVSTPGVVTTS